MVLCLNLSIESFLTCTFEFIQENNLATSYIHDKSSFGRVSSLLWLQWQLEVTSPTPSNRLATPALVSHIHQSQVGMHTLWGFYISYWSRSEREGFGEEDGDQQQTNLLSVGIFISSEGAFASVAWPGCGIKKYGRNCLSCLYWGLVELWVCGCAAEIGSLLAYRLYNCPLCFFEKVVQISGASFILPSV